MSKWNAAVVKEITLYVILFVYVRSFLFILLFLGFAAIASSYSSFSSTSSAAAGGSDDDGGSGGGESRQLFLAPHLQGNGFIVF